MLLRSWVGIMNQSTHLKCQYDNHSVCFYWLACMTYVCFSDDWIGLLEVAERCSGALWQHYTWLYVCVCHRPKWTVRMTVLHATAEFYPHLAGGQVLMSSPDYNIHEASIAWIVLPHNLCHRNQLECWNIIYIIYYISYYGNPVLLSYCLSQFQR